MTDPPDAPDLARRLSRAYAALVSGLLYPGSESDSPYEACAVSLDPGLAVDAESFRRAAGLAAWWLIDFDDADAWFAETIAYSRDPDAGADPAGAAAYEQLRRAMWATLDPPVLRVWVRAGGTTFHRTQRYLVGRVPGGGLAGLLAHSVET
jgi:hypothetical protein